MVLLCEAWVATSLSAVNKLDPADVVPGQQMDCRPVAKGYSLPKAVTKVWFLPFKKEIIAKTSPTQYRCGKSAGGSKMIFAIQLLLEAHPDHVIVALDVKNAYNEIDRRMVLDEFWGHRSIRLL